MTLWTISNIKAVSAYTASHLASVCQCLYACLSILSSVSIPLFFNINTDPKYSTTTKTYPHVYSTHANKYYHLNTILKAITVKCHYQTDTKTKLQTEYKAF